MKLNWDQGLGFKALPLCSFDLGGVRYEDVRCDVLGCRSAIEGLCVGIR